jgi:hypothetical protein
MPNAADLGEMVGHGRDGIRSIMPNSSKINKSFTSKINIRFTSKLNISITSKIIKSITSKINAMNASKISAAHAHLILKLTPPRYKIYS